MKPYVCTLTSEGVSVLMVPAATILILFFAGCCCREARRDQQILDAHYCAEELDEILAMGWKKAKTDDGMESLADESAKKADKEAGPPPEFKKTELPSRGTKDTR